VKDAPIQLDGYESSGGCQGQSAVAQSLTLASAVQLSGVGLKLTADGNYGTIKVEMRQAAVGATPDTSPEGASLIAEGTVDAVNLP